MFWKTDKQKLYSLHFLANTVTLTFGSTSIIQESVFSSCGDTLTQRRRRLVDIADLLEAVIMLLLVISYDNKNRAFESLKLELKGKEKDEGKKSQENKKQKLERPCSRK